MNSLFNAALRYAELGYHVFPCAPGAKTPLTKHGFQDATTDEDQISEWWQVHPSANVAIATEGLVVIDVDGAANPWLTNEPERAHELAVAPLSLTPGGGRHYVFRSPVGKSYRGQAGRLAPRVDVRADGGYIVVPPSVLAGSKAYRWAEGMELDVPADKLPEPPTWLVRSLDELATSPPTAAHVASGDAQANTIVSGQRNATLARLAGTMRRVGMAQAEIVAALHVTNDLRCVPPLSAAEVERIAASVARYDPDQISVAVVENHWEQMVAGRASADVTFPEEHEAAVTDPGPLPDELLFVPGFVADVMEFTLTTAPYPNRPLAFAGALALQSALCGRKVREPGNLRTNLQILALAYSGVGKDWPRKVNARVLLECGESRKLAGKSASGEGIEDRLLRHPVVLKQDDEIDAMFANMRDNADARYRNQLATMLELYGEAGGWRAVRDKAGVEHKIIHQPHLVLFGTTTPAAFYESMSSRMLSKGLLARLTTIEAGTRQCRQRASWPALPTGILETARWWSEFRPPGWGNVSDESVGAPQPAVIPLSEDAVVAMELFADECDTSYRQAERRTDEPTMAIWARGVERATQLALAFACSARPSAPVIDSSAAQWAIAFTRHGLLRSLYMLTQHFHETDFEACCNAMYARLLAWAKAHGTEAWMPHKTLRKRLKHLDAKQFDSAWQTNVEVGQIETMSLTTGGRPARAYRAIPQPPSA